ncbi:ABC transporter ATP-binding protein [Corynebacterium sp. 21KM1197]|uniref:ABC transporter ATP-binding protein n=1 Tax=Corynebacterium sp. 21KM1197 TaxID=2989734 RepID=UPI0029CA003B|nr:ATP-binding cassette domain-containing protein [Corynebacterium sp. 21KM1197]WPF68168.1 ATP-binding cassette domain-containing protein [Corynebacterium sp. 21KM1197]
MPESALTLQITALTKTIAGGEILSPSTLSVARGEICAIVGPNGAGKTTLFKLIAGLAFPTSGTITIFGQSFDHTSRDGLLPDIGVIIENPEFRAGTTAHDVLQLHFDMLGMTTHPPIAELLAQVGLANSAQEPVASFSLGMKQRLALARAIAHQPKLLILDEPTNGLDPTGIADLRQILTDLAAHGVTILIASHVLTELERTAYTVAVMVEGQLGDKHSVQTVLAQYDGSLEAFYNASVKGAAA